MEKKRKMERSGMGSGLEVMFSETDSNDGAWG